MEKYTAKFEDQPTLKQYLSIQQDFRIFYQHTKGLSQCKGSKLSKILQC